MKKRRSNVRKDINNVEEKISEECAQPTEPSQIYQGYPITNELYPDEIITSELTYCQKGPLVNDRFIQTVPNGQSANCHSVSNNREFEYFPKIVPNYREEPYIEYDQSTYIYNNRCSPQLDQNGYILSQRDYEAEPYQEESIQSSTPQFAIDDRDFNELEDERWDGPVDPFWDRVVSWQEQQRKYERESYETEQLEQMRKIFEIMVNLLKVKDMKEVIWYIHSNIKMIEGSLFVKLMKQKLKKEEYRQIIVELLFG